jgi:hypothetical protein
MQTSTMALIGLFALLFIAGALWCLGGGVVMLPETEELSKQCVDHPADSLLKLCDVDYEITMVNNDCLPQTGSASFKLYAGEAEVYDFGTKQLEFGPKETKVASASASNVAVDVAQVSELSVEVILEV